MYRLAAGGGELELVVGEDEFDMPNGLCFSPDESLLYVNDTPNARIRVYDVAAGGSLSNGRVFADGIGDGVIENGVVDGMKCDERGNIWVSGPARRLGVQPGRRAPRRRRDAREHRQPRLGRRRLADAVHRRLDVRVPHRDEGGLGPPSLPLGEPVSLDTARTALIIQDLQNDVIGEGGAFADSGAPAHAASQNVVENVKGVAAAARAAGVPVIHVHYIVEAGAPGLKQNAPLFQGVKEANALVRGSWGAAPVDGLEPQEGDLVVEKTRMNGFYNTILDNLLRGFGTETLVITGAWTNMSIEHTARHAADAGYEVVVVSDGTSTVSDEWQNAGLNYALTNVGRTATAQEVTQDLRG